MSPTTTRSTRCLTPRTSPPPFTRLVTGEVGLHYTDVRRSLGAVDDEKGIICGTGLPGQPGRRPDLPRRCAALGPRLGAARRPFVDLASHTPPAPPTAATTNGRELLLRWLRQQLRRRRSHQALSRVLFIARLRTRRRSAAQRFAKEMVELNLPPTIFEDVGTPAFYLNWLRPVGVRCRLMDGTWHTARRGRTTPASARRWTCASRSCTGTK